MAKLNFRFQDEAGINLNRYIATNVSTGEQITFDLLRGGKIDIIGTPLNAETLNALVDSINGAYDEIIAKEKDTTYTIGKNGNISLNGSDGTSDEILSKGQVDNINAVPNKADTTYVDSSIADSEAKTGKEISDLRAELEVRDVTVECDHEFEITGHCQPGQALAVDDGAVTLDKIQGQTQKTSNLFPTLENNTNTILGVTFTLKDDGSLMLNGTCVDSDIFYGLSAKSTFVNGSFRIGYTYVSGIVNRVADTQIYVEPPQGGYLGGIILENSSQKQAFSYNGYIKVTTKIKVGASFENYVIKPMIRYDDKFDVFQPYYEGLRSTKLTSIVSGNSNLFDIKAYVNARNSKGLPCSIVGNYIHSTIGSDPREWNIKNAEYSMHLIKGLYSLNVKFTVSYQFQEVKLFDKTGKIIVSTRNNTTFTLEKDEQVYFMSKIYSDGGDLQLSIFVGEGNPNSEQYMPHKENETPINLELGEFDYWQDDKVHRSGKRIILNGSENWIKDNKNRFKTDKISQLVLPTLVPSNVGEIVSDKYDTISANSSYLQNRGISLAGGDIYIYDEALASKTANEFKTYLQTNPISLEYKSKTETIEEKLLPNGYPIWKNGTEKQFLGSEGLTAKITKTFAISLQSQIIKNVEMDVDQQKQIDKNTNDIAQNVGNINSNSTQIEENKKNITANTETINGIKDDISKIPTMYRHEVLVSVKFGGSTFPLSYRFFWIDSNSQKATASFSTSKLQPVLELLYQKRGQYCGGEGSDSGCFVRVVDNDPISSADPKYLLQVLRIKVESSGTVTYFTGKATPTMTGLSEEVIKI